MFCFALNSSKLWWDNPPWNVATVDFFVAVPAQSTCFQLRKKYNLKISRRVVPKPLSCLWLCARMSVQYTFVLGETINFFELNWKKKFTRALGVISVKFRSISNLNETRQSEICVHRISNSSEDHIGNNGLKMSKSQYLVWCSESLNKKLHVCANPILQMNSVSKYLTDVIHNI